MQLVLDPCKYGLKANHDDHNVGVTKQKIKLADRHVRIKSLYIFLPTLAKLQRDINQICVVCVRKPQRNSTRLPYVMLRLRCSAVRNGKHIQPFAKL